MTAPNPSTCMDPKELHSVISSGLPNIANYIKVVLKKEKLSEEAEAKRRKYEKILSSLEQGHHAGGRPLSIICDDDGGYFSSNRIRVSENIEQNVKASLLSTSGFLLWQDEKVRWRRGWCKLESRDMRFYVYDDDTEEVLLRSFSLENSSTRLESQVSDLGKDNCFHVSGVLYDAIGGNDGNEMEASVTPVDIYLAAYTESECKSWTSTLQQLLTHDTTRNVVPVGDSSTWPTSGFPQDSVSSSSSNFSSNRDSMISNTSSLVNTCRVSSRSDLGEGKEVDDSKTLSVAKQQQPLPSPPQQVQVVNDEEAMPAQACEDDDNASVGTIYESIDNLVLQFDDAIRNMGENLKPEAKPAKKKDRSIFRQHSFLSSRTKSSKSNLWSEKRSEFEKGERYSGFMLKKNSGGSWKKKWCVLKGCIFGYYKSRHDNHGHECIILNGTVQDVQDERKSFVFYLSCTGVQDMYFAVEDEEVYLEWLSKLRSACASAADYSHALQSTEGRASAALDTSMLIDSIYNIPRPLSVEGQMYDTPNTSAVMTPNAAIDAGIYNVPRNLLMDDSRFSSVHEDAHFSLDGDTLDLYDYPRVSMSPDEEGIYDDPLDIVDMEIYDYPPDAGELGLEYSDWTTSENTRRNTVGESISVNLVSSQNWKDQTVPPLPNTSRPALFGSVGFISDAGQRAQNFPVSRDVEGDRPKSHPPGLLTNMALESDQAGYARGDFLPDQSTEAPDSSHLEYGQCTSRGYLYKKERFMTWVKLYCIIRNNFLECHKIQGDTFSPTLKLFLPGSEVKEGGGDAKKKWAFQVKHPRREGALVFACDSEEELRQWILGFQSGSSIQVQPVNTVEEIRITDLEMQKRWTAMDKGASVVPVSEDAPTEIPPRRKTFSAGTVPDDFASDTLKRRRKFSWVKSNFMRRKSEKKFMSGSQTDLNANRLSSSNFSTKSDSISPLHVPDPLRKSVSLELLPTATELPHNILSDNFQGYLRVQRKGADSVWVRYWCVLEDPGISCYISQRDLTLTLSIQLLGARVSTSELECQRKHSFKVYHVDSGQCLYFAADSHDDFIRWFAEITKKGQQVADDDHLGPTYFIPSDPELLKRLSVVSEGGSSNVSDSSSVSVPQPSATAANTVFYRGMLLKSSHTGKWKQRYCVASDGSMSIFRSSSDKVPITAISLRGISLELISTPRNSRNEFQFKLNPCSAGKCHTFAAPSETEMYAWISGLRDASSIATVGGGNDGPVSQSPALSERSLKKRSKKLKDADLVSYIPASTITSPDYSGYANIQFGSEPWTTYWCLAYSNCLYIYQNKLSSSTVKTVVLPGYEIKIGDLQSSKCLYNLSLQHEGVSPVLMSVESQEELNNWIAMLSKYSRAEGAVRQKKISGKLLPGEAPSKIKVASREKKGPVKANHNISGVKSTLEERSGSAESNQIEASARQAEPQNSQEAIIRRYEKRIKKTQRVANQTELKLKKQRSSLLHFKKELSRHVITLQELSETGDPHAQKRLKNVRMKLAQLEKIVPYLGKYVSVNRQAEMQTIAVLKESCNMELQKFKKQSVSTTATPGLSNVSPLPLKSPQHNGDSQPDCQSLSQHSFYPPPQDSQPGYQPPPPQDSQPGYQPPPPQDSQPGYQPPPPQDSQPGYQPPPPQDSQPDYQPPPPQDSKPNCQPPLLQPDYQPPPLPPQEPQHPLLLPEENPYASLSEIKKDPSNAPVKMRSNYAELDFGRVRGSDNLRPPSVKYCEVIIDSLGIGRVTPDAVSPQEKIGDSDSIELHDTTLTPDNVDLHENPESSKDQLPNVMELAPAEPIKSKSPPAVAKKPTTKLSPIHSSTHQPLARDSSQRVTNTDSNLEVPPSTHIAAGPSVADRIKALQHHHH